MSIDEAAYAPGPTRSFALLCAATLFEFVTLGMFIAAIPLFVTMELGASRSGVGIAVGAFSVSAVLLRPVVGRGVDRRGRRLFLAAAPTILAASAAAFLLAGSVSAVAAIRFGQGVAGACFYTAAATIATDLAPAARRAEYLARFSLFLYGGFAVGPALAEAIVARAGFGWVWAATGATALAALALALAVPETAVPRSLPAGRARRVRFVHPAAVGPGLVILTAAVGYTSITAFSPLYARSIGMASSGLLYAVFALTVVAVRLGAGTLADRHGRVRVAAPGLLAGAASMALLATRPAPALAVVAVSVFGAGFALLFPALMALTVDRVPDDERGEAVGSFTAFFDVGASLGSWTVGAVADRVGFGGAFAVPAALCTGGLWLLLRLHLRLAATAIDVTGDEVTLPEPPGA